MKIFFIILLLSLLICPNLDSVSGQFYDPSFNPNYIISDFELEDYNSIDLGDIQYFLNRHTGILKYYITVNPKNGKPMRACEIIYEAAQKYKINPKYLIVLLQKEQSLITNPRPRVKALDWATGFALCDSCNMNDPRLNKYKGFYNQVNYAAERNRFYIKNRDKPWLFQVNYKYNIDGREIIPLNQATACLYNYTPHWNGNYNFWKIWQKWFTRKYPNGSILKEVDSPGIWLIEECKRRPFITWTAFISRYNTDNIIEVNYNDLSKYPIGAWIKFANYSYLKTPDNQIYLIDNDKLRPFASPEVVRYFGVNPEEVINIAWEDYRYYAKGSEIAMNSMYPNGAVLKNKDSGEIYYVKDGIKSLIIDEKILDTNYPNQLITQVSKDELDNLEDTEFIKFKDGTLIKSKNNNAVYIISDGERCPIVNGDVFEDLDYDWSDIIEVSDELVNIHELGSIIESEEEEILPEDLLPIDEESKPL